MTQTPPQDSVSDVERAIAAFDAAHWCDCFRQAVVLREYLAATYRLPRRFEDAESLAVHAALDVPINKIGEDADLLRLVDHLDDLRANGTPGEWHVQDGCSWRRIGTSAHDGDVLCPTNAQDGWPDLIARDGLRDYNLRLIVETINALPTLLSAIRRLSSSTDKGVTHARGHR